MEQLTQKLTPTEAIQQMIQAVNADRIDSFYKVAEAYQNSLTAGGSARYKINNALRQRPAKLILLNELPAGIKKLLIQSPLEQENVFLNTEIQSFVDELIIEWNNAAIFKAHNLGVRNKLLLHGVTGNGKTTLARHLARLSKLPFVEISGDSVIDSHVGSTGTNIYNIFNQINEPCILFWDEVDSIGRKRGGDMGSAAGMENERMVNSMLTNIERLNKDVIFIGATNRMDILDAAFLRRFDIKLELPAPTDNEKEKFAKQLVEFYKLSENIFPENIKSFISYSDIKLYINDLARKHLLRIMIDTQ